MRKFILFGDQHTSGILHSVW